MQFFRKILSLCKRRGFLLELPGGCSGQRSTLIYGPLGTELKRNIINEWWYAVVTSTSDIQGVDFKAYAFHPQFTSDEMVHTEGCTSPGVEDSESSVGSELLKTAQYLNLDPPFGLAYIGPRSEEVLSSKSKPNGLPAAENECMNVQLLCPLSDEKQQFSQWQKKRLRWWRRFSSNTEKFKIGNKRDGDFKQQCSIQYKFPWGIQDLEAIINRGNEDFSNTTLSSEEVPKITGKESKCFSRISMEASVDQAVWAYLCDAYTEVEGLQTSSPHTILKLHVSLAPYKVAVLPADESNTKLCAFSKQLSKELRHAGISTMYCETGSLDTRLALQDEVGTPYRVVTEAGTLESGIVSLQDRDTVGEEAINGRDVLLSVQRMLLGARIN